MAITYTWKVISLRVRNDRYQDAVVQTYWHKIGTDEHGNTGTFRGSTPLSAANVPENEFISYNDLTEEIVLGWIQDQLPDHFKEHIDSKIQEQINLKVNPLIDKELPWESQ